MAKQITIPALPSTSITETIDFYVAMGFEITYQQERPNNYACVKYEDIEIHFFGLKGLEPANSYSTCLVLISDADNLRQIFATGLKQRFGKIPATGIPRITRANNNNASGERRFNVVDPSGNWIRFIELESAVQEASPKIPLTNISRPLNAAKLLVHSKGDYPAAAKMLDKTLTQLEQATTTEQVQLLVLRAFVALQLDEPKLARTTLTRLEKIQLSPIEQKSLSDELEQVEELKEMLEA